MGTSLIALFLLHCLSNFAVDGASILFFGMPQSSSHRRSMYPFGEALADRGHKVTFFSEVTFDDGLRSKHPNVTDRLVQIVHDRPEFDELWVHRNSTSFRDLQWKMHSNQPWIWNMYWGMMIDVCRLTVAQRHEDLKQLADQKWDLIVVDGLFSPCGILMTKLINAPYVILNPTCPAVSESAHRAVPYPAGVIPPLSTLSRFSHKKFFHRFHVAASYVFEYYLPYNWNRQLDNIAREKFALRNVPYITWFYKNAEFVLSDLPSIFEHPRPELPDISSIGGNCKSRVAVLNDSDWLPFVDDPASKGTILLSFGHLVQWRWTPQEIVDNVFAAFDQFPDYRIAFQYDGLPRPMPGHVRVSHWLPVPGILNHHKTKLHFTHGGAKSITESICANVPMIILPMFAEQLRNADTVERIGAGLALDKFNMTVENIARTIRAVLSDDRYHLRARQLRSIMLDGVKQPLDVGVFWAEQVIKRKRLSRNYFKHKGRELSWIVYFNVDVIAATLIALALVIGVLFIAMRNFWHLMN